MGLAALGGTIGALGGIIGTFIAVTMVFDGDSSIQEFLREGFFLIVLPSALLSLPSALIKHRAGSFAVALLVGVYVSLAIYFFTVVSFVLNNLPFS